MDEALGEFDTRIEQADFQAAAETIVRAEHLLEKLAPGSAGTGGCDAKIFSVVRDELRVKRSQLKSHLDELWRRGVVWQSSDGRLGVQVALQIQQSIECALPPCPPCQW